VTDEQRQYRMIELRPATYTLTFTLEGFTTLKRGSIDLTANFTATMNAELSKTRAPRLFLKADGTAPTDIVPSVLPGAARAEDVDRLDLTTQNTTVRHFLSFLAMRTTPAYAMTDNTIAGIEWRSSANSAPGNVAGITVPTLVMAGTCAAHLVPGEITFDRAAAKDKQFVAVEGADHNFQPCKPQYGDTAKRAFDCVDGWLTKAGRV